MIDIKSAGTVLIRGGGDLASGVALRLHRAGMQILITELAQPLVIRRSVSFAEAVYQNSTQVEEVTAHLVETSEEIEQTWDEGSIPVLIDPETRIIQDPEKGLFRVSVLVDGRMTKGPPYLDIGSAPFMIGLGPGFVVGENCDAVVETNRGHFLGRVIWEGSALPNSGVPVGFGDQDRERVLRSPGEGIFHSEREMCERLDTGDLIGEVNGLKIRAPFKGVLRGLLHTGLHVSKGFKIGDLDPRDDPEYCQLVSDKSLAVAGGVLEAILSKKSRLELKK